MAGTAKINPSSAEMASRNVARCQRIFQHLKKINLKPEKRASLTQEYSRRKAELQKFKTQIDELE